MLAYLEHPRTSQDPQTNQDQKLLLSSSVGKMTTGMGWGAPGKVLASPVVRVTVELAWFPGVGDVMC